MAKERGLATVGPYGTLRYQVRVRTGESQEEQHMRLFRAMWVDGRKSRSMFYYSTPPPTQRNSEDLDSHNIAALCHTFKLLIDQLPMDIFVFCNGINLYERSEWLNDLVRIVNCFNQIAQNARLPPIFKLLMTSAGTSRYVEQQIEPQQRVRIRQGRGNGKGITQRAVMNAATRPKLLPEPAPHRPGYLDMSDEDDSDGKEYEYQSTRDTRINNSGCNGS